MNMRFLTLLMAIAMMLAALYVPVYAQVPAEVSSLSLGGSFSHSGDELDFGFLGGVPLSFINGHVAWFALRSTHAGEVFSETLNAHLQGGYQWQGWELNGYGNVLRDIDRELQQVESGYFIQFPKYMILGWQGTGGAGNAAQTREAVAATTGLKDADLDVAVIQGGTRLLWFAFANLHHPVWDVDLALNAKPTLGFDEAEFSGTVMTSFDLGNLGQGSVSFDVSYQGVYETERRKYFSNLLGAITWEM